MADPRAARAERGFTLVELMVAFAILLFGVTTLIGALGVGLDTRRSAEMKGRASALVGHVLHDLEERLFAGALPADGEPAAQGAPAPLVVDQVPGHPGLGYRVEFAVDQDEPDLVLATIAIRWQGQGETFTDEYRRILLRQEPFPQRVRRMRSKS
jgi:prepilin-type N-terminal cleavage/methylation domain-containing protein